MNEVENASRRAIWQLLAIVAGLGVGYVCTRTLRFTNDGLNLAFVLALLVIPFFAIQPVRRLHRWPKVLTTLALAPVLAMCVLALVITLACDIPALVRHEELTRDLGTLQQGRYTVHLLWRETAGGAVGPHGVSLEQRMFIAPGLYVVKELDYYEEAHEGTISAVGRDKVRLHIPNNNSHQEVNEVYSLKPRVFF